MGNQKYTDTEAALIDGVIASLIGRMRSDRHLQDTYVTVHEHLQDGGIDMFDLKQIDRILTLADSSQWTECRKETQRDFLSVHLKTRSLLRAAEDRAG